MIFALVDIPGEVVDSKRLQTIKAEIKRMLWYQDIEDLFALLFTTKHRINTSKNLKAYSALIFLTALLARHFCMWLVNMDLQTVFL